MAEYVHNNIKTGLKYVSDIILPELFKMRLFGH